jgi:hypothetical protein
MEGKDYDARQRPGGCDLVGRRSSALNLELRRALLLGGACNQTKHGLASAGGQVQVAFRRYRPTIEAHVGGVFSGPDQPVGLSGVAVNHVEAADNWQAQ